MKVEQNILAEYVSPGHPDRLADAIVEGIVDAALAADTETLVGVEAAVHTDKVFVDGRVAAGNDNAAAVSLNMVDAIVRNAYADAGYGGIWQPAPAALVFLHDLCLESMSDEEREIRILSDDQNVVIGYACSSPETNNLPPAHWLAWQIGLRLAAWRMLNAADKLGPDFKVLPWLGVQVNSDGAPIYEWKRLTVSILHVQGLDYEQQHRLLLPPLQAILADLEKLGMQGVEASFKPDKLLLNGAGYFEQGGPHGDNGLSGKKLIVDHYGPTVPIGGGALCGKDPHKIDRCGALRARQWARQLVADGAREARVTLSWAPGSGMPHYVEAAVADAVGCWQFVPPSRHPALDWFSIRCIVADLGLAKIRWAETMRTGYFVNQEHPWEHVL
ncbi:MAG: methionine adenosyltransferase domain-containing protein [bacterium]